MFRLRKPRCVKVFFGLWGSINHKNKKDSSQQEFGLKLKTGSKNKEDLKLSLGIYISGTSWLLCLVSPYYFLFMVSLTWNSPCCIHIQELILVSWCELAIHKRKLKAKITIDYQNDWGLNKTAGGNPERGFCKIAWKVEGMVYWTNLKSTKAAFI